MDEYTHPTYSQLSSATGPRGAALDNDGNIYVVGSAEENIVTVKGKTTTTKIVNHWLIRRGIAAADGTVQWTTTDFAFPTSKEHQRPNVLPMGVACVGNNVFVVGGGGTDGNYWRVMKSSNGGTTWTVADNFVLDSRDAPALAHSIAADSPPLHH